MKVRGALLIIAGVLLSVAPGIRADSLQLKNGNFVQGKYMGGTERAVQFEVNGKMRMYDVAQILSISFGAASVDGGMPSKSAAVRRSGRIEVRSAAKKSSAPGSAPEGQRKATKIQGSQVSWQIEWKTQKSRRGTDWADRSMRANWAPAAGNSDAKLNSSFVRARFARLAERIKFLPA